MTSIEQSATDTTIVDGEPSYSRPRTEPSVELPTLEQGRAPEVPVSEALTLTPMVWEVASPASGRGKAKPPPPPRNWTAKVGARHEIRSRIFHAAFYAEDELEQIAGLIRFDRDFYRAAYLDSAMGGLNPVQHFLTHGLDEHRLPADPAGAPNGDWLEYLLGFDGAFYEARYPDTAPAPHEHFIRYGAREHRLPFDLHDNLVSEQLLMEVLETLEIPFLTAIEGLARHEAEAWRAVPEALLAQVERSGIVPKPFRNNFWIGMALGYLAQCRFGLAVCCYNFFFNYYVPISFLGNANDGMIGVGCIFTIIEGLARSGAVVATPDLVEEVMVSEPVFLNRPNRSLPPTRLPLPRPVYGILQNVEVIGGTSLMIQDGHVVLYDYVEYVERARELQSPNLLHIVGRNCSFRIPVETGEVSEAFSMLHDHGNNYHHWLLEVLPRYLLARRNGLPKHVPLLVESDIPAQMRDALRQACPEGGALIEVARGASVLVKRLHVTSDLCINTVHTQHEPERGDILFSPSAIEMLRELASPHFVDAPGQFEKILIVRRNVNFRRVINHGVLLKVMKSLGLWSFDPGGASWADQVRVFSNARLIVAEAGAALANLAFCRPGAKIVVLVNGHKNSNYFYLTQLAQLVGADLYFFECLRLTRSHEIEVQDDMIVPVGQLADWIERFRAEPDFRPFETDLTAVTGTRREARAATERRVGRLRKKVDASNGVAYAKKREGLPNSKDSDEIVT